MKTAREWADQIYHGACEPQRLVYFVEEIRHEMKEQCLDIATVTAQEEKVSSRAAIIAVVKARISNIMLSGNKEERT